MNSDLIIRQLNDADPTVRINAAAQLAEAVRNNQFAFPAVGHDVNNHIHTIYSFSPYSPTAAVYQSRLAGLATCGLMDHDSIGGAEEFTEAGRILGIATTQGCEVRAKFNDTFLENIRINNPDQDGIGYIALHGVPQSSVRDLRSFLDPIRQARLERNRLMVDRLNDLVRLPELALDFDSEVVSLSTFESGGEITERHILYALALKLINQIGKGKNLTSFVADSLGLPCSAKVRAQLDDAGNPYYAYDLLNLFKSHYVSSFYIQADEECPPICEVVEFTRDHSIILAYPYLGDVTASVTGDKKAQSFEDEYLDELFPLLKDLGFNAITYMPSRNTKEQLLRLMTLCEEYDFFQISGEDINSPRQSFVCEAMRDPLFAHLYDAAWACIGHEQAAGKSLDQGMFSVKTMAAFPDLQDRIRYFKDQAISNFQMQ